MKTLLKSDAPQEQVQTMPINDFAGPENLSWFAYIVFLLFTIGTGPGTFFSVMGSNGFGWIIMLFLGYIIIGSAFIIPILLILFNTSLKHAKKECPQRLPVILIHIYSSIMFLFTIWICIFIEVHTSTLAISSSVAIILSLLAILYFGKGSGKKFINTSDPESIANAIGIARLALLLTAIAAIASPFVLLMP